jgi:hypothetical protein
MTKDEALDKALEALEYIHEGANNQGPHTGISWRCVAVKAEPAITAIKQARALDKKAENARELGLDYEPDEWMTGCPECGIDSGCDCDSGTWNPPAPQPALVQEPVCDKDPQGCWSVRCQLGKKCKNTPPAQPAPVPLTDEQKLMCWARATHDADVEHKTEHQCLMDYGVEIEAAHGIKENT